MDGCRHALVPYIIGKDHGQILIEYAHHSCRSQKLLGPTLLPDKREKRLLTCIPLLCNIVEVLEFSQIVFQLLGLKQTYCEIILMQFQFVGCREHKKSHLEYIVGISDGQMDGQTNTKLLHRPCDVSYRNNYENILTLSPIIFITNLHGRKQSSQLYATSVAMSVT